MTLFEIAGEVLTTDEIKKLLKNREQKNIQRRVSKRQAYREDHFKLLTQGKSKSFFPPKTPKK